MSCPRCSMAEPVDSLAFLSVTFARGRSELTSRDGSGIIRLRGKKHSFQDQNVV